MISLLHSFNLPSVCLGWHPHSHLSHQLMETKTDSLCMLPGVVVCHPCWHAQHRPALKGGWIMDDLDVVHYVFHLANQCVWSCLFLPLSLSFVFNSPIKNQCFQGYVHVTLTKGRNVYDFSLGVTDKDAACAFILRTIPAIFFFYKQRVWFQLT